MVAISTLAQEDAKRPNRERESLVGEQSRIVNRMKAALARLGIRGFNPKLKKAVERLDGLRRPKASRSRRTHWLNSSTTWSAAGSSAVKSGTLRGPAWSASSKPPVTDLMSWFACWRG